MKLTTEIELVEALQPIRYMALATSLNHMFSTGIYDLLSKQPATLEALASALHLEPARLTVFAQYLRNEGYLNFEQNDLVELSDKALRLSTFRPWYEMMVGGYAQTFVGMGASLKKGAPPASRNASWVGIGSCGISMFDSIPVVKKLVEALPHAPNYIFDLGCGSGVYLTELCKWFDGARAVGIEPDFGGAEAARLHVQRCGMADRIEIVQDDAISHIAAGKKMPDLLLLCFVIHEILGQSGRQAAIEMLKAAMQGSETQRLIIIDIDYLIDDFGVMSGGLAKAHYNPYFLLHPFTSQKLESQGFWDDLFDEAGLEIEAKATTNPKIDPTGICMGWLLKRK